MTDPTQAERDLAAWTESVAARRREARSAKLRAKPVSKTKLGPLLDAIAMAIPRIVAEHTAPLLTRIAALEQKPSGVQWCGVFENKDYKEGSLCTFQGGLWLAMRPTRERPNDTDSGWQLIVKSGHVPDDDGPRTVRTGAWPNGPVHTRPR